MRKYKRRNKNNLIKICILLFVFLACMTVGYSLFSDTLVMNGSISLKPLIAGCAITISDSPINLLDSSKTITISYVLENILPDNCEFQYSTDDGVTWNTYASAFNIYDTTNIKARCILVADGSEISSEEKDVTIGKAQFVNLTGSTILGFTGLNKNQVTSIEKASSSITLEEIQQRIANGENIQKLSDSTYGDDYVIYGWRDPSNNRKIIWWTNADIAYFSSGSVSVFNGFSNLQSVDLSGTSTSKVASFSQWFWGCTKLTSLDVSNFNTSQATTMYGMFYNCQKLTSLNVSSFNTSNVKNMASMFGNLYAYTGTLDLGNFDTSQVTTMANMFNGSNKLTGINVSSFNTSKVTDGSRLFASTKSITELDVSSFDTSRMTNMYGVFSDMNAVVTIYASNTFVTAQATNTTRMFNNASNLVGGNGTVYDPAIVDGTYAVIDAPGTPGYFTAKP